MAVHGYEELKSHVGHQIVCVTYGDPEKPANVAVECETCNEVLLSYDEGESCQPTGILVRMKVAGKWDGYDIADPRVSDEQVVKWLRSRGKKNEWAERCVLLLLGRDQKSAEMKETTKPGVSTKEFEDVVESFKLAMKAEGIDDEKANRIVTIVEDAIVNNLGD